MKTIPKYLRILFLGLVLICGIGFAGSISAAELTPLIQGAKLKVYPISEGKLKVYKDTALTEKLGSVIGKNLVVTISRRSGSSLYGWFRKNGKIVKGWFDQRDFLGDPSYEKQDAMVRYAATAYRRPEGEKLSAIPAYAGLDLVGQSGNWYQVIYKVKNVYLSGWLNSSDYKNSVRIYDGTEKRIMAEGVYTIRPRSNLKSSFTAAGETLTLTETDQSAAQKFSFQFLGSNCYRIVTSVGELCLTAQEQDGAFTGQVVLAAKKDGNRGQSWQLTRYGGYYYMRNVDANLFLTTGDTFTLEAKSATTRKLFRISMVASKNPNWQIFCQYDPKWGGKLYGKTNTIAASACGVFSMVNALYALNGQFLDPMKLADFSVKQRYRVEGHGTSYKLFEAAAKKFGGNFGYSYVGSTTSLTKLQQHLQNGTAVAYVPGHYMAVGDYKSGKYLALDSYATDKRQTSPFGKWITGSRFLSGSLKSKNFFLFKSTN